MERELRLYGKIINRVDWETDNTMECYKLYFYENEYYLVYMINGEVMDTKKVEYTDYRVVGDILEKTCCICGKEFSGYGNNPDPVKKQGRCCDECNNKKVIPARLKDWIK